MKFMHTKLPEFLKKVKVAATKYLGDNSIEIRGLESIKTAKMQSLRTGRIEQAVEELSQKPGVDKVEVSILPRIPETMHTVVIKSIDENGQPQEVILELMNIIHPTEEVEIGECEKVDDRRPQLGRH